MSEVLQFRPTSRLLRSWAPSEFRKLPRNKNLVLNSLPTKTLVFPEKIHVVRNESSSSKISAWTQEGSLQELHDSPVSVDLLPICTETHFDRALAEAQQLDDSLIIVWYVSDSVFFFLFQFIWGFWFFVKLGLEMWGKNCDPSLSHVVKEMLQLFKDAKKLFQILSFLLLICLKCLKVVLSVLNGVAFFMLF